MKTNRHAKFLEFIHNIIAFIHKKICCDDLQSAGFDVTQATVSRDMKELRLIKILSENGKYRYSTGKEAIHDQHRQNFTRCSQILSSPFLLQWQPDCSQMYAGYGTGNLCRHGGNLFVRYCRYTSRR